MGFKDSLGDVFVQLRLNTSEFSKALSNAVSAATTIAGKIKTNMLSISSSVATAFARVSVVIAGASFALSRFVSATDNVAKAASRMGLGTDAFQDLAFKAKLAGAEVGSLETAMKTFTRTIASAESGSQSAIDALLKLESLSHKPINLANRQESFQQALTTLSKITDETERAKLAFDLLGARSADALLPLLKELGTVDGRLKGLSTTITSENLAALEDLDDRITILSQVAFAGLGNAIGENKEQIASVITSLTQALPSIINFFTAIASEISKAVQGISLIINGIKEAASAAKEFITSTASSVNSALGSGGQDAMSLAMKSYNEETKKAQSETKKLTANIKEQLDLIGVTKAETTDRGGKFRETQTNDVVSSNRENKKVGSVSDQIKEAKSRTDRLKAKQEFEKDVNVTLKDAFGSAGKYLLAGDFKGALQSIADSFANSLMKKFTDSLADALTSSMFSGSGGFFNSIFSVGTAAVGGSGGVSGQVTKSGQMFAIGGSPPVGQASLVGERGAELFVPQTAGTIIPNDRLGGTSSTLVQNNTFNGDAVSRQEMASWASQLKSQIMKETAASVSGGGKYAKNFRRDF